MAVSKKYRRTIICNNVKYFWWITKDEDYCDVEILYILSQDKKVLLAYPLNVPCSYVISKGKIFQNNFSDGHWHRYQYPAKRTFPITPKFVSDLILWATEGKEAVELCWNSKEVFI